MYKTIKVCHSLISNTGMGLIISLRSNTNHLISLIPESPQILDIYSAVVLFSNSHLVDYSVYIR